MFAFFVLGGVVWVTRLFISFRTLGVCVFPDCGVVVMGFVILFLVGV